MRRCARPLAWWLAISAALAAGWGTSAAPAPRARAAIFFAADGMRQDLVERYAAEGATPAFRRLLEEGARAEGAGALPAFPPNTGVGWPTLATGAWPAVHGAVNNTFHEVGGDFARSQRAFAPGVLQAETLAEAAERAGRRVVVFEWPTGRYYPIKGPAVDYRTFFSRRGILTTFDPPGLSLPLVREFGLVAARAAFRDASGWTDAPQSHSPAREAILVIPTTNEAVNPARVYWLYVFDSTNDGRVNYDHVLVAETKSARAPVAILRPGYFVEVKVKLAGGRAGQAAGFYLRLIDLAPDLSRFRLYFTSVSRVSANDPALEETLASRFPTVTAADFGPLEAGLVDEETYVDQALLWERAHWPMIEHIIAATRPDLVLAGFPLTDEFSHQFLALVTPGTPVFDDADRDGRPDGRAAVRSGYLRRAYAGADRTLALLRRLMPADALVMVSADHGFAPTWKAINASKVLLDLGLQSAEQRGNCWPARPTDQAKACWTGGTAQIYLNVRGRDRPGVVDPADVEAIRQRIFSAFLTLRDPVDPAARVIETVLLREEAQTLRVNGETVDAVHSTRSGDVIVISRPPYQFDAAPRGQAIGDAPFFGQHGFLPGLVDLRRNINMRVPLLAAGPGIPVGRVVRGVRMIDLAPTIAHALGIPAPARAQGRVLVELFGATR